MTPYYEVVIPRLGVNDEEVTIVEWLVRPGDPVTKGQRLAVVETSKASSDLESEENGFIYSLVEAGECVSIRAVVAIIAPNADAEAVQRYLAAKPKPEESATADSSGRRFTVRAKRLVEERKIDVSTLPTDRIIRERDVFALLERQPVAVLSPAELHTVAIYGASQGGLAVAECLRSMGGYDVAAFLDDDPGKIGALYHGIPVWAGRDLERLGEKGVGAVATHLASGNLRLELSDRVRAAGLVCMNVIHARAHVAPTARLGVGNLIKAGAVVDAYVEIGDCCIIDNGVILPHHNRIGDGCHLAPGACFGGDCEIGDGTVIGIGATISARTRIGSNVIVGAGAVVVRDIPDNAVVEGAPARTIGERKP
jgi:sugar O-acyltransferase (sialic acid O-acetyltransferase NeuD family)